MPKLNPWLAGLMGRCPECGEGALFDGFLKLSTRCKRCDCDLSRADPGDGGLVIVLIVAGAIGCAGLMYTELAYHPPIWLETVIWLPVTALLSVGAMRLSKALHVVAQFRNNASQARLKLPAVPARQIDTEPSEGPEQGLIGS